MSTDLPAREAGRSDWDQLKRRLEQVRLAVQKLSDPDPASQQKILRDRAAALARGHAHAATPAAAHPGLDLIECMIGGERYGFETRYVAQVHPICDITAIPGAPGFMVGIVILHGEILSLIDLRALLKLPLSRLAEPNAIVVLKNQAVAFGILVEKILGAGHCPYESIEYEMPSLAALETTYLKGISHSRTAILDAEQLLSDPRLVIEIN